ncbi:MAG: thioesterase family protein [Planctomycetota bacterium]
MSREGTPSFPFRTEVRVRLPETDAMGIVFHGNYFTYLEVGRVDYLRNLGLSEGIRPIKEFDNVVAAAHLDFKSPARLDDPLTIDVRVREIGGASFTFEFQIRHRQQNRLVAVGYTTHVAIDESFRPMRVPDDFRRIIGAFEGWPEPS